MLQKALKHDMRATLPIWLFLSAITLACSLILGFSVRDIVLNALRIDYIPILPILGILLSVLVIVGYLIATFIFVAVRYYQNFFTDEGYLTFTLPVKRTTLFFSKVLSGCVFVFASIGVLLFTLVIAFSIVPSSVADRTPMIVPLAEVIWELFSTLFRNTNQLTLVLQVVAVGAIGVVFVIYQVLAIYLCVSVGSVLAKKWKVAAAILCYYVSNIAINLITTIGQVLGLIGASSFWIVISALSPVLSGVAVLLVLVVVFAFFLILTAGIYRLCTYLIEKKLNLA